MSCRSYLAISLIAALCGTDQLGAQSPGATAEQQLVRRVLAGDIDAIHNAEVSGNSVYVEPLIGYIRDATDAARQPSAPASVSAAQKALALLITTAQMQKTVCDSISERSLLPVSDRFRIIGGWFGIRALQMMLAPEADVRWQTAMRRNRKEKASDVSYMPPRFYALQELTALVADLPLSRGQLAVSPSETEAAARTWTAWISSHARELEQLRPTGEGVVFSEKGCR